MNESRAKVSKLLLYKLITVFANQSSVFYLFVKTCDKPQNVQQKALTLNIRETLEKFMFQGTSTSCLKILPIAPSSSGVFR